MNGRPPRRLSRHDRVLLEAWGAELDDAETPADLGGGLRVGEAVDERRMVAAVVAALDDTAGADPAAFGHALDARDVPGLLWLLGGLVAVAGDGRVAWLDQLDDRGAR